MATSDASGPAEAIPPDVAVPGDIVEIEQAEAFDADSVTTDNIPTARPAAAKGYWIFLTVLMLILFEQVAMGYALYVPILGQLAEQFHTAQIGWVITAWTLTGALLTPLFGKLADKYGKKRMLLVALGGVAIGSLIATLAPTFEMFLLGRVVMAFALPIALVQAALMRDIFPKKYLSIAYGFTFTGAGILSISAPFIAGWLNDNFGFHAISLFLCGFAIVSGLIVLFLVPESKVRVHTRLDIPGWLLLAVGGAAITFTIGQAGTWGWNSFLTWGMLVGGAIVLVLFFVYERARRDNHPLVEFDLLKSRGMIVLMIAGGFVQVLASLFTVLNFTLLQMPAGDGSPGFGVDTGTAALYTLGGSILAFVGGMTAGTLGRRTGFRPLLVMACVIVAGTAVFLTFAHGHLWAIVLGSILSGLGAGIIGGVWNMVQVENIPVHQQGAASGTIGLFTGIGTSVWVQVLFAVMLLTVTTFNEGAPVYNNMSFIVGYLFAAVMATAGALITFLLPRHKPILAS